MAAYNFILCTQDVKQKLFLCEILRTYMNTYLPHTIDYLQRFFSSKYEGYFEDMCELRPQRGYGHYYRDSEVTQAIRNIVHNISETFSDMRIPEGFSSPAQLVHTLVEFKAMLEKQNQLLEDVISHYKDNNNPPMPAMEIYKINNEVLDAVKHVLSTDEAIQFLTINNRPNITNTALAPDLPKEQGPQSKYALIVGLLFVILVTGASIAIRNPTTWQLFVLRGIFAIGLAAVASVIPGFINLKSKLESKTSYLYIVAGGAISIFIIVWAINPPDIIITERSSSTEGVPHVGPILQPTPPISGNLKKENAPIISKSKQQVSASGNSVAIGIKNASGNTIIINPSQQDKRNDDTNTLPITSILKPILTLIADNNKIHKELVNEYNTGKPGVLESYLEKVKKNGPNSNPLMHQRIFTIVNNNDEIIKLLRSYEGNIITAEFKQQSDLFRDHALRYKDRFNAIHDIYVTKGQLPSAPSFPEGFIEAINSEILARLAKTGK